MAITEEFKAKLLKPAQPCPFCHSIDLVLINCAPEQPRYAAWEVVCVDCEAGGPTQDDPGEAVKLWNEAKR